MRSAERLPSRGRVRVDELTQQRPRSRRIGVRRVEPLDFESELLQLGDRGSSAAELGMPKRPKVGMLVAVRGTDDRLRVIRPALMPNHDVPCGGEAVPSEELVATDL